MICTVPTGARRRLKSAHNVKHASLRLARKANVAGKLRQALACGNQKYGGVEVYRSAAGGNAVRYCDEVVYHNARGKVTTCKFDPVWVDVLDVIIARVNEQQQRARRATTKIANKSAALRRRYSVV